MSLRPAIICSAHGLGHLTRQLEVAGALRARGTEVELFTSAPRAIIDERLPGATVRRRAVDVGIAQPDSLHEDIDRTRALLDERCSERAIDDLAALLVARPWVLVDIAPAALEAARRAGVPALAVGNFDWAWIYRHYPPLHAWAARFTAWQAPHPAVQLWPGPGLHGFARTTPAGLLGRSAPPVDLAPELSGAEGARTVLVSFGGFGLRDLDSTLPRLPGTNWVLAPPSPPLCRPDARTIEGVPFPSLVASVDAVFTKPGYGIFAECTRAGTPIVWVSRGRFPEAPALAAALARRGDVRVEAALGSAAFPAALRRALETLWRRPRPRPGGGTPPALPPAVEVILDSLDALDP